MHDVAFDIMLEGSNFTTEDLANLMKTNKTNRNRIIEYYKRKNKKKINDLLLLGAKQGDTDIVLLIEAGADIEIEDSIGSALIYASLYGHTDIVKLLINEGADVHRGDKFENTPLMYASRYGHIDIVKLLIEEGVDIYDDMALIWASKYGNTEIVKLLSEIGADVNKQDDMGITALMWASIKGNADIVKLLLEADADIEIESIIGIALENTDNTDIINMIREAGVE